MALCDTKKLRCVIFLITRNFYISAQTFLAATFLHKVRVDTPFSIIYISLIKPKIFRKLHRETTFLLTDIYTHTINVPWIYRKNNIDLLVLYPRAQLFSSQASPQTFRATRVYIYNTLEHVFNRVCAWISPPL